MKKIILLTLFFVIHNSIKASVPIEERVKAAAFELKVRRLYKIYQNQLRPDSTGKIQDTRQIRAKYEFLESWVTCYYDGERSDGYIAGIILGTKKSHLHGEDKINELFVKMGRLITEEQV